MPATGFRRTERATEEREPSDEMQPDTARCNANSIEMQQKGVRLLFCFLSRLVGAYIRSSKIRQLDGSATARC